jgi:hypothetical protein
VYASMCTISIPYAMAQVLCRARLWQDDSVDSDVVKPDRKDSLVTRSVNRLKGMKVQTDMCRVQQGHLKG